MLFDVIRCYYMRGTLLHYLHAHPYYSRCFTFVSNAWQYLVGSGQINCTHNLFTEGVIYKILKIYMYGTVRDRYVDLKKIQEIFMINFVSTFVLMITYGTNTFQTVEGREF